MCLLAGSLELKDGEESDEDVLELGSSLSPGEQQESYKGPADAMLRYGGSLAEDEAADEADQQQMSPPEETPAEALQRKAEEAGIENDETSPVTEDELADDLQGAFPRIPAAHPHVVQSELNTIP